MNKQHKSTTLILRLIQAHKGRSNPIQVKEIMESLPLTYRKVRKAVQYLVNDMNYPIGSTTKEPYGFFMIVSFEDYLEAVKSLNNTKYGIEERLKYLQKACINSGLEIPNLKSKSKNKGKEVFNIYNTVSITINLL